MPEEMLRVARIIFLLVVMLLAATAACGQQVGEGIGPGCVDNAATTSFKDCCRGRPCARTIQFQSKLIGATLPYRILVPSGYDSPAAQQPRSFPVLYLLHGLGGHYTNWIEKTKLLDVAARFDLIIITPEGNDGWYTDSATIPADKYETYIIQELIPDVEQRFRAFKGREGRAVAGLSMGGYGALKFALKYPDRFAFAASISGALDPAVRSDENPRNVWSFMRPSVMQTFGPMGNPTRAANDLHRLVREFPAERIASLPFLYLDCGTEDSFLATNRELATILLERKIPHEFRQLPGKHDWAYWDQQVREVLKITAERMPLKYFTAPAEKSRAVF